MCFDFDGVAAKVPSNCHVCVACKVSMSGSIADVKLQAKALVCGGKAAGSLVSYTLSVS